MRGCGRGGCHRRRALVAEEGSQLTRSRVVEHQSARQWHRVASRPLELVAQLDRAERVEPRLHERHVRVDAATHSATDDVEDRVEVERHRLLGAARRFLLEQTPVLPRQEQAGHGAGGSPAEQQRPLGRPNRHDAVAPRQRGVKGVPRHRTRDSAHAALRRPLVRPVARRVADLGDGAPLRAEPAQARVAPAVHQRVEPRVGRRVRRRGGVPDEPRHRRVGVEVLQRAGEAGRVQPARAVHLGREDRGEVAHRLVAHRRIRKQARGVVDPAQRHAALLHGAGKRPHSGGVRHVATGGRHGNAAGEPRPVRLAAALHAPAARRKHQVLRATPDEHACCQQAEPAEPTREEVGAAIELLAPCARRPLAHLGDDDRLRLEQQAVAAHAVGAGKAARRQDLTPVLPRQQRAWLVGALRVARKHPPPVGQAKRGLQKSTRSKQLIQKKEAPLAEQAAAVSQRVADEGRRVQHVGGDGEVERSRGEALEARVGVDVEQLKAHEAGVLGKAPLRLVEEDLRHVGEHILLAHPTQPRQHARCRAARAGANLDDAQEAAGWQAGNDGVDRGHHALVVEASVDGVLVHGQRQLHGPSREEELLVGDGAEEGGGELGGTSLSQANLRPEPRRHCEHVFVRCGLCGRLDGGAPLI
mmetsp:Transcript_24221/g.76724  ORF Transcript_24221/g.76724 Transcript_24221/m.76724 type:complete len:643 (+) Transcript_24221:3917-5845(+)